jgi:hypothetical protein
VQIAAADQYSIRGDEIAGSQFEDIAWHNFFDRNGDACATTANVRMNGDRAFESIGGKFRPVFLDYVEDRRQRDNQDNDSEACEVAAKSGYGSCYEQDCHKRLAEALRNLVD